MRLSVCCSTIDAGPRIRAALSPLREIADEIVIAVDSSCDPEQLGHYEATADRLVRFEFSPPIERCWPWLFGLCSGDWILYMDGSDVLSAAFLRDLPAMIRRNDVRQYWLLSRWLYPDRYHWLDQLPWNHFLNRLVRNEPARLHVPGLSHTMVEPSWPVRFVTNGLYRTRCLLSPEEERRERVRYYSDIPRDQKREGSDRWLFATYLPEQVPSVSPVAVPPEDLPGIEAVLDAAGPELPTSRSVPVPLATRDEIDRSWPGRTLPEGAYEARIEPLERDRVLTTHEHAIFRVRVTNLGPECWPGGIRSPLIRVSYYWRSEDGSVVRDVEPRTPFPAPVPPGTECVLPVVVIGPERPGRYTLEFDLIHEFVRWFDRTSSIAISVDGTSYPESAPVAHIKADGATTASSPE